MRLSRLTFGIGAAVICLGMSTISLLAQAAPPSAGPWMGVWRMNPEKTAAANMQPAPTTPQTTWRIFRMVPVRNDAFKYTIESMPAGGGPSTVGAELIGRFDGKEYIEIGNAGADTNKMRILDANSYEVVDVKDGKETVFIRVVISPDGTTRTSYSQRKNAQGQDVKSLTVYDRVE